MESICTYAEKGHEVKTGILKVSAEHIMRFVKASKQMHLAGVQRYLHIHRASSSGIRISIKLFVIAMERHCSVAPFINFLFLPLPPPLLHFISNVRLKCRITNSILPYTPRYRLCDPIIIITFIGHWQIKRTPCAGSPSIAFVYRITPILRNALNERRAIHTATQLFQPVIRSIFNQTCQIFILE